MLRVVLIDDHQLFRQGLRALLGNEPGLTIVGEAGDAREAIALVEEVRPDVALIDIGLPGMSGVALTRELMRHDPHPKVIILTMHAEEEFVAQALAAGASGYALKHQPANELGEAVREVAGGGVYLSPRISRIVVEDFLRRQRGEGAVAGPLGPLSPREREVFDLLVRGADNDRVARELTISVKTVETHRAHILKKLHVHSMADLIRFAARHRLVTEFDRADPT